MPSKRILMLAIASVVVAVLSLGMYLTLGLGHGLLSGLESVAGGPRSQAVLEDHVEAIHKFLDARLARINAESSAGRPSDVDLYRAFIGEQLGVPDDCRSGKASVVLNEVSAEGISGQLYAIGGTVCDGALPTSGLFAVPSQPGVSAPLVVAIHGTAASPELLFGLESGDQFETEEYHNLLAERLLRLGFAVYAPRIVTDWQRQDTSVFNRDRNALHRRSASMGSSLVGIELGIMSATLTELLSNDHVQDDVVGAYGISLGGLLAFYLTAIDTRIDAVVVSQWLEPRADKLASREHPASMWRYEHGDYTLIDDAAIHLQDRNVAALIAPRPFFVEAGENDLYRTEFMINLWPELLDLWGSDAIVDGRLCMDIHPGAHEIHFENAARFLVRSLPRSHDSGGAVLQETGATSEFCPQPGG